MPKRRGPKGRSAGQGGASLWDWLDDFEAVSACVGRHDLEALLDAGGGLALIRDFLPHHIAEQLLAHLQELPEGVWNDTSADDDYAQNNIRHSFRSTKAAPGARLDRIFRAFSLLAPGSLHTFSVGRYTRGDHIAPHDDRAFTQVLMDDGRLVECSRTVAIIYYLTRDWSEAMGGALLDLEATGGGGQHGGRGPRAQQQEGEQQARRYVPAFNSLVAFRIPRWHQVTPLATDRPRYSVFGWLLEPGRLYDLGAGAVPAAAQASSGREAQQRAAGSRAESGRRRAAPPRPSSDSAQRPARNRPRILHMRQAPVPPAKAAQRRSRRQLDGGQQE